MNDDHPPAILIVEDEPLLLLSAQDLAQDAGLAPLTARDAEAAILLLERRDDIRLVFSDIDLPGGMDGLALVAAIHGRWPAIKLILTSGHHPPEAGAMPEGCLFFSKPYSDRRLARAMLELVA